VNIVRIKNIPPKLEEPLKNPYLSQIRGAS